MLNQYLSFGRFFVCAAIAAFSFQNVKAQSENSLSFDGVDDKVIINGASSLIASASGISLSCWVYATNPSPNPNYDGIAGFRNETSCDFYLLHLNTNTLEARFRNSSGTAYTANVPGFQINTWQHLVMTYNGSTLKVYINATQAASIPASGSITATNVAMTLGNITWQTTNFQFGGQLDEIGLWSKSLTPAEISCMYSSGHDNSDPNLELFYKCDQGTPAGNNGAITSLVDSKGNINGGFSGFAMTGSSSNFLSGISIVGDVTGHICKGDSFSFAGNYYERPGTYFSTVPLAGGCDSIVRLVLTMDSVDATIKWVNSNSELRADENGATYQWINCDTKQAIQGQTRQNYRPTQGGAYACVVTKNGCTDTSTCFTSHIGLDEELFGSTKVYPNPSSGRFVFDQGSQSYPGELWIFDSAGKKSAVLSIEGNSKTDVNLDLPNGIYSVVFKCSEGTSKSFKLVVEN